MDEFALIRSYFDRGIAGAGVTVGIGDDGAVLVPTPGREQVQVIDTLVEGVHFPDDMAPEDIGYRVVAVNLSDIAAMGAVPRWMTLALTLRPVDEEWVEAFAAGLFEAASEFGVALVGGDMTGGKSLVATVHMTGEVEAGRALLRRGARPGDTVYVTGTLGDAAAALELFARGDDDVELSRRFRRPAPRLDIGRQLAGVASAAIDVSDGLIGDLAKLLEASGVGAQIDVERVPLSAALRARFDADDQHRLALTGGDDYELCFTGAERSLAGLDGVTAIGRITGETALEVRLAGAIVDVDDRGYRHFQ